MQDTQKKGELIPWVIMYYGISREFKGVDFVKIKEVSEKQT